MNTMFVLLDPDEKQELSLKFFFFLTFVTDQSMLKQRSREVLNLNSQSV